MSSRAWSKFQAVQEFACGRERACGRGHYLGVLAVPLARIPDERGTIIHFEFTDSEGGVTYQCKLDSHAFAACTSPKTYTSQADGSHTFTVRASDEAGNTSSTSYTRTIDTEPPLLTITQAPPNPSPVSTAQFQFTATDATSVTFGCQLDGGAFAACTSPTTYSALVPGPHVRSARDGCGRQRQPCG
jgi:hypothetical protein